MRFGEREFDDPDDVQGGSGAVRRPLDGDGDDGVVGDVGSGEGGEASTEGVAENDVDGEPSAFISRCWLSSKQKYPKFDSTSSLHDKILRRWKVVRKMYEQVRTRKNFKDYLSL